MPPFPWSIAEDVKALDTEQPVIPFRLRRRIINHLFEELKSYDWYVRRVMACLFVLHYLSIIRG